jgi:hypothetical protein
MTSPPRLPPDHAKARRDRLLGRLLIVGLGLLVVVYLLAALHARG